MASQPQNSPGTVALKRPRSPFGARGLGARGLTSIGKGLLVLYLTVLVLLPIAAVISKAGTGGMDAFLREVKNPEAVAAIKLTLTISVIVVLINAVFGTILAWVLVRDDFRGKPVINAVIDLPFALPTIVAGITLIALYGHESPFGINVTATRFSIVLALLFVTLPFVVRAVQPLLLEMDRDMEEAAASLGAGGFTVFRRIIFPNLLPGIGAGVALAFARALGEFGSLILISGNIPFKTLVSSVYIFQLIEQGNSAGASAVSVVLLLASLVLLAAVGLLQRLGTGRRR